MEDNGEDMPVAKLPHEFFDVHEERITRLEDGFHEVSTGLATNAAKIEALGDKVDLSVQLVVNKIESCIVPLAEKLAATTDKVEAATVQLATGRVRFAKLETQEDVRVSQRKLIKRIIVPCVVASSGWIGHHIWDIIFKLHK